MKLKAGVLCYYDTVECGLVPCKCTSVYINENGCYCAKAVVTEDHLAYKIGMEVDVWAMHIVPRKSVYQRGFETRIRPYGYEVDHGLHNG